MVDARRVAGWVVTPEGGRSVCPRCEGQAFIRLKGVRPPGLNSNRLLITAEFTSAVGMN
jgi:hypothetical protein